MSLGERGAVAPIVVDGRQVAAGRRVAASDTMGAEAAGPGAMGTREKLERIAPVYDLIDLTEHTFKRPLRRRLFAGLGGTILDAGVGTGRNMAHYPGARACTRST